MKQTMLLLAAMAAGFIGGIGGSRLVGARPPEQVVRARKFELLDDVGRPIGYWGVGYSKEPVLVLGRSLMPRVGRPQGSNGSVNLDDPTQQRLVLGVVDDAPYLALHNKDGQTRAEFCLGLFEKPLLWMGDENGKRLSLGVQVSDAPSPEDNNWGLIFDPNRAGIGMLSEKRAGQRYLRGDLFVMKEPMEFPY